MVSPLLQYIWASAARSSDFGSRREIRCPTLFCSLPPFFFLSSLILLSLCLCIMSTYVWSWCCSPEPFRSFERLQDLPEKQTVFFIVSMDQDKINLPRMLQQYTLFCYIWKSALFIYVFARASGFHCLCQESLQTNCDLGRSLHSSGTTLLFKG